LNCEELVLLFYTDIIVSVLVSSSYTHMDFFQGFMCVIKLYMFAVMIIRCMNSLEVRALFTEGGLFLLFETGFHFPLTLSGETMYQLVKGLGYRLMAEVPWFSFLQVQDDFFLPLHPEEPLVPPSQLFSGYHSFFAYG